MMQYRQGDVFLVRVRSRAPGTEPAARERGRLVLAHGEATGHAHVIRDEAAELYVQPKSGRRYLRLVKPARLDHEEHTPIELPAGLYEVRRQIEYTPEELRTVAD